MSSDLAASVDHIVGLNKENGWSDLLACLIEVDPEPFWQVLGDQPNGGHVRVIREHPLRTDAAGHGLDRVDLLVMVDDFPWVVIEAKLLAGFGQAQLDRYRGCIPDARHFLVVHSSGLGLPGHAGDWRAVTWEQLIAKYAESDSPWASATARAWLDAIRRLIPAVGAETRWNDIEGVALVGALRARVSWVVQQLSPPAGIGAYCDLVTGGGGRSPVARIVMPSPRREHVDFNIEMQEALSSQAFSKLSPVLRGPVVKVVMHQSGITTTRDYDWPLLLRAWRVIEAADPDGRWGWVRRRPPFKAEHDRQNHRRMVDDFGMPSFVGFGYAEGQTHLTNSALLGVRMQLAPDSRIHEVADVMNDLARLLPALALLD